MLIGVNTAVGTVFAERARRAAQRAPPSEAAIFAYLFSSRATGGARSDVHTDLAVLPADGLDIEQCAALRNRFAEIIQPAADREVGIVLLDEAPLPLCEGVLWQRLVLYSAALPRGRTPVVRWESLSGRM